ncbi:MAG TPA: amidohydrolase family protein [Candidatus Binataceae bacterium]|nr:amidohydrolase family protein [Candidatus Binataceae bacterium]
MHDLVIRNATIVDGTGASARGGDIAIDAGKIVRVEGKAGAGREEIDANGLIAAPGWVDIHTHYDGQAAWDPYLTPSSWNGVTTVVMGNCGVGFAPVRPGKEGYLISLMDAVEDIPSTTLAAGIHFEWESFGQYLDAMSRIKRAIDVGAHVPHCAIRPYVMGERGAASEAATSEEIAQMAAVVRDSLRAGALGFSTSRTHVHRTKDKGYVPGTFAAVAEVGAMARALGEVGHGVFEIITDVAGEDADLEWVAQMSRDTGRPVSLAALISSRSGMRSRELWQFVKDRNAQGAHILNQVPARPTGILMSLESTLHPFATHRSFRPLLSLTLGERLARMRDPQVRAQILADEPAVRDRETLRMVTMFDTIFPLGDPPDYEPAAETSIGARARALGVTPQELAYDTMLENEGRRVLYGPLAYNGFNLDPYREMLTNGNSILSLSDGGAHCGTICDASMPTYILSHWVRDRSRGEKLPLEFAVKLQTSETAKLYGLEDRGILAPGKKADINLIDFANLRVRAPETVYDLPAGGRRFVQRAEGYKYTIVSGEVVFQDGEPSGAMPGKVVRGGMRS